MSLQIFDQLEQGSDQWLQARCGLPTASTIGKLLTPKLDVANNDTSRGLTETLVAERITGHVDYVHPSFDMQLGTMNEPLARDLYREQFAPVHEIGFAVRDIGGLKLGGSPDGLVGEQGGIEIKSRRPKTHLRTILSNTVPAENMAQIQTLMLILERDWFDYVSYCQGFPLFVIRVYPDLEWRDAIKAAIRNFEANAAQMIATYKAAVGNAPAAPYVDHFQDIEIA
jgi:hypothetical protein